LRRLFYNIGIIGYASALQLVKRWNPKAKAFLIGRQQQKLKHRIESNKVRIWFHAASVGEFEQARPVIESLDKNQVEVVVSFFSPSGFEQFKNYRFAEEVYYLPLDIGTAAKDFVRVVNPDVAVFVKYDFWLGYFEALIEKQIPTLLISSIFRDNHFLFSWMGKPGLNLLKKIQVVFVQDRASERRLLEHGFKNVKVSGDTRVDQVLRISKTSFQDVLLSEFSKNSDVLVAGSTWASDEKLLLKASLHHPELKFILAPHEILPRDIERIESLWGERALRYSKGKVTSETQVVIIDNIGMLSKIYRFGTIAYVGGGFGEGIHNVLEPFVYGIPVFFGPNNAKFREAQWLKNSGVGFEVSNSEELSTSVKNVLSNRALLAEIKKKSKELLNKEKGGAAMVSKEIEGLLKK